MIERSQVRLPAFIFIVIQGFVSTYKKTRTADITDNKKLSYCWETVRRGSMPRIAEMDVEMTT